MQSALQKIEAAVGIAASFMIGLSLSVVSFVVLLADLSSGEFSHLGPVLALFVGSTTLAALLVCTVRTVLERIFPEEARSKRAPVNLPRGVFLATRRLHRLLPWPLAVVLSALWFAHFASGVLVTIGAVRWVELVFDGRAPLVRAILPHALGFAFLFAANLYVLLALGLQVRRPAPLEHWWRWRVVIDLFMLLVAMLIVRFLS
ncbi:MAG TPA: hypothetical protein VKD72_11655 [Gemmataceae bacterium]|nr:hypothetical protein [Gemmataceae bacterium]